MEERDNFGVNAIISESLIRSARAGGQVWLEKGRDPDQENPE
ncbi:MAG: hypothetical protein PVI20_13405 [Desulfobacteraceae bacterium]|jgi:hypothetical protein